MPWKAEVVTPPCRQSVIVSAGFYFWSGSTTAVSNDYNRNWKLDDGGTKKNSGCNSLFTYFCLETRTSVTVPEMAGRRDWLALLILI